MNTDPAFPCKLPNQDTFGEEARDFHFFPGVTLLDYFAVEGLRALITAPKESFSDPGEPRGRGVARTAYDYAEEMMAERERRYGRI